MDYLVRILTIMRLIQREQPSLARLAALFNTSERTIYRDIERIREAGYVISSDKKTERVAMESGILLPHLHLSPEEALALLVVCYEQSRDSSLPFFEAAKSAAIKLLDVIPEDIRNRIADSISSLKVVHDKMMLYTEETESYFEKLLRANLERQEVKIRYKSPSEPEEMLTSIYPYKILFNRRAWYVIGFSSLHRQVRTFHLARIKELEFTGNKFGDPLIFNLERHLGNAWNMLPEPGKDHEIHIRFSKLVAENVSGVAWHKTQRIAKRDDGSVDFYVTVSGLSEISWWILGYGKEAEVVQPEQLRKILRLHAEEMLKIYAEK